MRRRPYRVFYAPNHCDDCKRITLHTVSVWQQETEIVHNTRRCNHCGTANNFYTPLNMFKLFAAGAVACTLLYFITPLIF